MPRPLQRAALESGIKLDLNRLARRGFIQPGALTRPVGIKWANSDTGELVASGIITADMSGAAVGWFRIQIGELDQQIKVTAYNRYFGGKQWYFICPDMNRRASVLWMPRGARKFASRQAWGRRLAYASQFQTADDRALRGKAKINARLCSIGGFDPSEWEYPPKPKGMRWRTYNRLIEKFDHFEEILDAASERRIAKMVGPDFK